MGDPLTVEEKNRFHEMVYGKSLAVTSARQQTNQIIETTAMLKLQQQRKEREDEERNEQRAMMNGGTPVKEKQTTSNKQIETRTPDGRRRITPIFLAPNPDLGEAPLPFSSTTTPTFGSSKETSKIIIEKKDSLLSPPTSTNDSIKHSEEAKISALDGKSSEKPAKAIEPEMPAFGISEQPKVLDKEQEKAMAKFEKRVKRKLDVAGPIVKRHKKDKEKDLHKTSTPIIPATPLSHTGTIQATPNIALGLPTSTGLALPSKEIKKKLTFTVPGSTGIDSTIEVENKLNAGLHTLNRIRCCVDGKPTWENILPSPVIALTGNKCVICAACEDRSISMYSTSGRRLFPNIVLDSKVSLLNSSGNYVMVITSKGAVFVWNIKTFEAQVKNESLSTIITDNETLIEDGQLTEQGLPIVTLSNGKCYLYKPELGCWLLIASPNDPILQASDHHITLPSSGTFRQKGQLATLQAVNSSSGRQASRMFQTSHPLQQSTTLSLLESQLCSSYALHSTKEYHFWLLSYTRYLVQEGMEAKLREVCDNLLGPMYKSKNSTWCPTVLSFSKHDLLQEILPVIGSNLELQRLFSEYHDQLESIKK